MPRPPREATPKILEALETGPCSIAELVSAISTDTIQPRSITGSIAALLRTHKVLKRDGKYYLNDLTTITTTPSLRLKDAHYNGVVTPEIVEKSSLTSSQRTLHSNSNWNRPTLLSSKCTTKQKKQRSSLTVSWKRKNSNAKSNKERLFRLL